MLSRYGMLLLTEMLSIQTLDHAYHTAQENCPGWTNCPNCPDLASHLNEALRGRNQMPPTWGKMSVFAPKIQSTFYNPAPPALQRISRFPHVADSKSCYWIGNIINKDSKLCTTALGSEGHCKLQNGFEALVCRWVCSLRSWR